MDTLDKKDIAIIVLIGLLFFALCIGSSPNSTSPDYSGVSHVQYQ